MEQNTLDFIESLGLSTEQKEALITAIDWEKELSWSFGYETAYTSNEFQPMSAEDSEAAEEFLEYRVGLFNQFDPIDGDYTYGDLVKWLKDYKKG
jgi:hypothetical protein